MNEPLKKSIIDHLGARVNAVGFAPLDRFEDAPDKHHPSATCKDAQTVVVLGITVPQGMLRSPDYNLYLLHRSYHTVYAHVEDIFKTTGDVVETGEVIATAGDTGSMSGTNLQFEIRHHGKPLDPLDWLKRG